MIEEHDDTLEWILRMSPNPWVLVSELIVKTGYSRREIRELASERGYASGNDGLALIDRLSPAEQMAAFRRIKNQAFTMLRRAKRMRQKMRAAGTYPLPLEVAQ